MKVCSFCGKTEGNSKVIITNPKADICGECVVLCMEILLSKIKEDAEIKFEEIKK